MNKQNIYFDNASSTPLRQEVIEVLTRSFSTFGNPNSPHFFGRESKSLMEQARKNIAKKLNISSAEIIFCSGATEANNLIIQGAVKSLNITRIISSPIEHQSVIEPIIFLEKEKNINVNWLKIDKNGNISLTELEEILSKFSSERILVSLMHINNEIGTILPIKEVSEICKKYKAYFHSDMVQSMGKYPIDLQDINLDFATASGHKFYGLKGAGFCFIKKQIPMQKIIFGGEQEKGLRAGTESLHNIISLEKAFIQTIENQEFEKKYIEELKQYFISEIKKQIPNIAFNAQSDSPKSAYNIINIGLENQKKSDTILIFLELKGIAVSKGSACQSGSVKPSRVLTEILNEEELKRANLRISFSIFNKKQEIDYFIEALKEFIK